MAITAISPANEPLLARASHLDLCFFRVSLSNIKAPRRCVCCHFGFSKLFKPLCGTVPAILIHPLTQAWTCYSIDISLVPEFCSAFIDPVQYNILLEIRATSISPAILGSSWTWLVSPKQKHGAIHGSGLLGSHSSSTCPLKRKSLFPFI